MIPVDGGEGRTGAAPLEFSNYIGSPLIEGLIFVHNALVGFAMRDKVRVIASGNFRTLDLTGGAPEMHPRFRELVATARAQGMGDFRADVAAPGRSSIQRTRRQSR